MRFILNLESVGCMCSEEGTRTPDLPALQAGRANQLCYLSNAGADLIFYPISANLKHSFSFTPLSVACNEHNSTLGSCSKNNR